MAYEMRISDWSSDVCSSDLNAPAGNPHLVIGPWYHGQEITEASALGAIKWGQDTGLWFRRKVLAPFLAQYLVDDAPKADIARVTAFETGANQWQRLSDWPTRSEEHTSELQSLMRLSYAVFCLKKKKIRTL